MSMDVNKKASEALSASKAKLYSFERNWNSFATEAPQKILSLIKSGIKPSVSRGPSVPGQISVQLNFESNMDAAKEYVETVKEKLEKYSDDLITIIKNAYDQLKTFTTDGIDSDIFKDFVSHIDDCVKFFSGMKLVIAGREIEIETPDEAKSIQSRWKKASDVEIRKNEAKKYGVSLEMLDIHKKYLSAVESKKTGKTSAAIKEAKKTLLSLDGYLDSANLASECDEKIEKLLAKEAEEKRIAEEKRAEEERIRKEEERQRKLAEEEKKKKEKAAKSHMDKTVEDCNAKVDKFGKELDAALKKHMNEFQAKINSKLDELSTQKTEKETYLSTLGFFKFAEKKETKNAILQLTNEISLIKNPELIKEEKAIVKKVFDKAKNDYSKTIKKYLELRFPGLVPKPVEYDFSTESFLAKNKSRSLTKAQVENEVLKLQILLALTKGGRKTISDIQELTGIESNQRTSALLRQLREEDEVVRAEEKGMAVFSLAGSAKSVLDRLPVKPTIPSYTEVEKYAKEGCPMPPQIKDIKLPVIKII